jgi:hypothetical protein
MVLLVAITEANWVRNYLIFGCSQFYFTVICLQSLMPIALTDYPMQGSALAGMNLLTFVLNTYETFKPVPGGNREKGYSV